MRLKSPKNRIAQLRPFLKKWTMSLSPPVGIIGGSGLYQLAAFTEQRKSASTPRSARPPMPISGAGSPGTTSSSFPGTPRPQAPAGEIPHRANIHGFKQLGVRWIISISAVGSLQHDFAPGDVVLPDQFFDRTKGRAADTFFGDGIVAHVAFGDPISPELQEVLHMIFGIAPVRSGNGAKLSSAGLWLNASKSESMLETTMLVPRMLDVFE